MTQPERWIFALFGLVGLALSAWATYLFYFGLASRSWPAVPGTIVDSRVESTRGHPDPSRVGTPRSQTVLRYEYTVGDQVLRGHRISYGYFYSSSNSSLTAEYRLRYQTRNPVSVHYDPVVPSRAVLEPGVRSSNFILFGIGLLLTSIGLLLPLGLR